MCHVTSLHIKRRHLYLALVHKPAQRNWLVHQRCPSRDPGQALLTWNLEAQGKVRLRMGGPQGNSLMQSPCTTALWSWPRLLPPSSPVAALASGGPRRAGLHCTALGGPETRLHKELESWCCRLCPAFALPPGSSLLNLSTVSVSVPSVLQGQ